jgi:hypothetical protein
MTKRFLINSRFSIIAQRAMRERSTGTVVSDWCCDELSFNEPGRVRRFSLHTRNYVREPLDAFSNDDITDIVLAWGTRCAKTTVLYAGTAFKINERARRVLYVKPTTKGTAGAEGDARTRFIPMLRASKCLAELIPGGPRRHDFKTAQQILLNGSIVDWTGSNSVANLASNSMECVMQDEVDKFNTTRRRDEDGKIIEADASDLADERTGEFPNPKRVKASTPTLPNGRIWTELLKTDLRRRFVPCPLCSRLVVIAWSEQFTVLPKVFGYGTSREPGTPIPLAYVEWDKESRRADGTWDLERVEKSAGYVCPHCFGRFHDDKKIEMDAAGVWQPTQRGAPRSVGYHLPSMYASHTTAGKLALDFLEGKRSIEGPRNFVNSKLAEPYSVQGVTVNRSGIAGKHIEVTGEWLKIMSVDHQQKAPYFWALVRAWNGTDASHALQYRALHQWYELDELQERWGVIPSAVIIDVGFSQAQVLQECANVRMATRTTLGDTIQGTLPECIGWTPAKAFGGKRLYQDSETGLYLPYRVKRDVDPYAGTELAHTMRIELLEYLSDVFEDMLENIRHGKTGLKWTIAPEVDTEEYHKHMAGKVRRFKKNDPRSYKWETLHSDYPDHLRSCEELNLVHAYRLKLISFDAVQTKERKNEPTTTTPAT